jgi:RimJ/RimL family protein N-acetyltransferase
MPGRVHLTTPRLELRRFTADDVDLLVELDSDPAVMRFINGGRPTPREEIRDDVLPHFLGWYERSPGYGFFAAVERGSGKPLGWFHLRPSRDAPADEPELGYRLQQTAWGRGYATEGSSALVDSAFRDHRARRVVAETMVVHTASRRVMEKVGLRLVRTFQADWPDKIAGDELGDVEYAITREEWVATQ